MSSLKIKALLFKTLSIVFSIILALVIVEFSARLFIMEGHTFAQDMPSLVMVPSAPSNGFKGSFELPHNLQVSKFERHKHIARDPRSISETHHMDLAATTDILVPRSLFSGQVKRFKEDQQSLIYAIQLSTDKWRRRITPSLQASSAYQHITLFGGSYAFGDAVSDDQTLLAYFTQQHPNTVGYNIAFSGYGPNDVLTRILNYNALADISPPRGVGIYLYADNHIKRSTNSMSVVTQWKPLSVTLQRTSEYSYEVLGNIQQAQPLYYSFIKTLSQSRLIQYFQIDWPLRLTSQHYDEMARTLKAIEREYKNKTTQDNPFIVVFYPEKWKATNKLWLKQSLDKHQIYYIDYTDIEMGYRIPDKAQVDYDGHPTPEAYAHLAKMLNEDLTSYFNSQNHSQNKETSKH